MKQSFLHKVLFAMLISALGVILYEIINYDLKK